jgi:hypothetical protein
LILKWIDLEQGKKWDSGMAYTWVRSWSGFQMGQGLELGVHGGFGRRSLSPNEAVKKTGFKVSGFGQMSWEGFG